MAFYLQDFDITFHVLSGIVALLVSFYAFRYNRLLANSTLKFISVGFLLLGIGLLTEASVLFVVAFALGDLITLRIITLGTSSIYNILQIVAYLIFAVGYIRTAYFSTGQTEEESRFSSGSTTTVPTLLLLSPLAIGAERIRQLFLLARHVFEISEILAIIFLSALVVAGVFAYFEHRNHLSFLVLVSFAVILVSHFLSFWSIVSLATYLNSIAAGVQFVGFLSLLIFILWSSRIGPARKTT